MKNKSLLAWMIIGVLLLSALGLWLWANNKKSINWEEHFTSSSKDPYGVYLLKELIKFKYDTRVVDVTKSINQDLPIDEKNNNYIYIGQTFDVNDTEQKSLFAFIENGNNAFIAAKHLPYSIRYLLKNGGTISFDSNTNDITYIDTIVAEASTDTLSVEEEIIEFEEDENSDYDDNDYSVDSVALDTTSIYETTTIASNSTVSIDTVFSGTELSQVFANKISTTILSPLPHAKKSYRFEAHEREYSFINSTSNTYEWKGISTRTAIDSSCVGLSVINDTLHNFIKISYGKGSIYVFTTPILLTNYFVKTKDGLSHAEEILSVLSNGKIYWDEVPVYSRNENSESKRHAPTILKYILTNESLRWAWYLLLATVLVYIVFESKRKQRIIPVMESVSNTSIEYVQTTGRLYAQIGNHRKLIQLNMKLFLSTIQQKYGVKADLDKPTSIEWLSIKTGIAKEHFETLQNEYKRITVPGHEMKTKDLHAFYQQMQFIYKKIQN